MTIFLSRPFKNNLSSKPLIISKIIVVVFLTFLISSLCHAISCKDLMDDTLLPVPGSKRRIKLYSSENVFAPGTRSNQRYGSRLLKAALSMDLSAVKRILIIGTGTGYEAVVLAMKSTAQIDAIDIDPEAVFVTKQNAKRYGVQNRINAIEGDLFQGAVGKYDLILFSAPRPFFKKWYTSVYGNSKEDQAWWKETVLGLPGHFDPEGQLFKKYIVQFPQYLASNGAFLLMTERNLSHRSYPNRNYQDLSPLFPDGVDDEILSTDPWVLGAPENGYFSIHKLTLKQK